MIPLFYFNVTGFHVKHGFLRVVSFIGLCVGVLALTVRLNVVQAAVYEGQWTRIILDKINASSLDLKGTVTATGPDLTPKSYNLPANITSARLAKLARGFLRTSAYGVGINAAMMAASWLWSESVKNWVKTTSEPPLEGLGQCPIPKTGCGSGPQGIGYYGSSQWESPGSEPSYPPGCDGYLNCHQSSYIGPGGYYIAVFISACFRSQTCPNETTIQASDQDIFDDGVKPRSSSVIPDIITGLPDVIGTPSSILQKPGMRSIYWPEIVLALRDFIANLNLTQNLFDIVNQAYTDISSLTQDQINTLINSGIDIQTLINAINNTVNNIDLTTEQKTQLELWNNLQNPTTNPPQLVPPEPLTIPTDCDLIPFVCAWLEWYRGWLTEEPPPIPEVAVPIEDLGDFDLWPTDTSGSCPAPYTFSVFGQSVQLSYQPWCDLAVLIAPLLMGLGWLFASYIVLRVR
jgi:hypothetical protein